MLEKINDYFGNIGYIKKDISNNTYKFSITYTKNCTIVKKHFDKYPLMTYKLVYYKI
jgi:hypothetical protein